MCFLGSLNFFSAQEGASESFWIFSLVRKLFLGVSEFFLCAGRCFWGLWIYFDVYKMLIEISEFFPWILRQRVLGPRSRKKMTRKLCCCSKFFFGLESGSQGGLWIFSLDWKFLLRVSEFPARLEGVSKSLWYFSLPWRVFLRVSGFFLWSGRCLLGTLNFFPVLKGLAEGLWN